MILLDTDVLIYASEGASPYCPWARETIAEAVAGDGAVANAVCLAELCVGDAEPDSVAERLRSWGIVIADVPAAAAEVCAAAYRQFRERRARESGKAAPAMPLPDFFIGAHAQVMDWELATADASRFRACFPGVRLKTPR